MRRTYPIFALTLSAALLLGGSTAFAQGISQLQQLTSTTSPTSAITQTVYGKPFKITGLATGQCLTLDANSLLTVTPCGSGASFGQAWEINAAGYLAPTTTITALLNNGFVSQASSTVGNGTQTGGLTISGGSTTTLNAFFSSNLGVGIQPAGYQLTVSTSTTASESLLLRLQNTATAATGVGAGIGFGTAVADYGRIISASEGSGANSYLSFYTRGSNSTAERFRITSTGNVGIGTTTPATPFHIQSGGSFVGTVNSNYLATFAKTTASNSQANVSIVGGSAGIAQLLLGGDSGTSAFNNGRLVYDAATNNISLWTSDTEKLTVTSAGNLGIGTTSPFGLFSVHVNGGRYFNIDSTNARTVLQTNDNSLSPTLVLRNTLAGAGNGTGLVFQLGYGGSAGAGGTPVQGGRIDAIADGTWTSTASTQDSALRFLTTLDGSATEVMRLTSAGNVGIGTTSPWAKLSVEGISALGNQAIGGYFTATSTTASSFAGGLTAFASSTIGNGTFGLTINGPATTTGNAYFAGNAGIGTTSPYAKLSIGGDVAVGASSAGGTLGDLYLPKLGAAAGSILAVDTTGKVIATTTPSSNGASTPSGSVMLFAASAPPTGWFLANNQSFLTSAYPTLAAAIGDIYGRTNGQTFTANSTTDVLTQTSFSATYSEAVPVSGDGWAFFQTTTGSNCFTDDGSVTGSRQFTYTSGTGSCDASIQYTLTGLTAGHSYTITASTTDTQLGGAFGNPQELYLNGVQMQTGVAAFSTVAWATSTVATSTVLTIRTTVSNGNFGGGVNNRHRISNITVADTSVASVSNGQVISISNSGGALPTGLSALTNYYVVNQSGVTFKVSLSSGGAAVDFSSNGTGTQTLYDTFRVPNLGSTSTPAVNYIIKQ